MPENDQPVLKRNMAIWDKAAKTDPAHTKAVGFGARKFTAIDPMYQVKRMTELFGQAGERWGFEVARYELLPTDHVAILVRLHVGPRDGTARPPIEQFGQASLYIDNAKNKPDADAMKKATTDGLTKCFSYIGLNADVWLGQFDDNKYVEEMREQHTNKAPAAVIADEPPLTNAEATVEDRGWREWADDQIAGFAQLKSIDDLDFWKNTQLASLNELGKLNPGLCAEVRAAFAKRKTEVEL